jgi:hypothetical protein
MAARRFTRLIAVSMFSVVTLFTAACSSSGGGTSSSTPTASSPASSATGSASATPDREWQLTLAFVQCLAQHNIPVWDKSDGNQDVASLGTKGGWYEDGKVVNNVAFGRFFQNIEGTYPIGSDFKPEMTVTQWIDQATSTGTWPKVCGSLPPGS